MEVFRRQVDPLAAEVEQRWKQVWPGEAGLHLTDEGELQLQRRGGTIDFEGFSGGERAIAVILLRVLSAQMAGNSPFLWLDEPLEHLDSRNRRLLASLLAAAARAGGLSQVVVTTYEDGVTRQLGRRFDGPTGCRTAYIQSDISS